MKNEIIDLKVYSFIYIICSFIVYFVLDFYFLKLF